MATIATDTVRYGNLVKQELWPANGYTRDAVIANETTAKTYAVGTVLGLVTATGKYKISLQAAADGSQNPAAVVLDDYTVPANTDTTVLAMTRGPAMLAKGALLLDASFSTAPQKAAAYAALEAKLMLLVNQI